MADDLGKLEVQLSLLSAQESAAFREIQQTAKSAMEMMQMFKSRDFIEAAERLAKVHKQMVESSKQMGDVSRQLQEVERQQGVRGRIGGALSNLGQKIGGSPVQGTTEQQAHERLAEDQEEKRKDREDRERQKRLESMTDVERAAEHRRTRLGLPPTWEDNDPDAIHNKISSLNPNMSGIKLPQFGELTIQDLLGQLGAVAQNRAAKAGSGTSGYNTSMKGAYWLDKVARGAGNVAAVGAGIRMGQRYIIGPAGGFMRNFDETMPMGYHRDSNPFSDVLGVQTPFSAYGGQSAREKWDTWAMRWSGGINKEQAEAINMAANQAGFTGQAGTSVRRDLMAPAFRQMKIDPNNLIPFTQTLRTGTADIQTLNQVIMQLGEGARAARMDVNSYTQAVSQSGEAAQASGGRFIQGAQFGNQFANSFGLSPTVGTNLLQNQVVQGYAAARTGLPPSLTGAMSPLAQQRSIEQALMDRVSAYTGTMPSHREPIKDVDGNIIGYETTSGRDAAVGAAARDLGINQEEALAILNRKGSQGIANFKAGARDYLSRATGGKTIGDADKYRKKMLDQWNKEGTHRFRADEDFKIDPTTGKVLRHLGGIDLPGGAEWSEDKEKTRLLNRDLYGKNTDRQARNATGTDLRELHKMAMAAGVSQEDWEKQVDGQKDVYKRTLNAQRLVDERNVKVNEDPNAVKFTGPAAKFFEALVKTNRDLAGAADLSKAVVATSNSGPAPLTSQSNASGTLFP
jgi:hypothetical protein